MKMLTILFDSLWIINCNFIGEQMRDYAREITASHKGEL